MAWLKKHTFEMHSLAFALMVISSAGLYLASRSGADALVIGWLGVYIVANLLLVFVK